MSFKPNIHRTIALTLFLVSMLIVGLPPTAYGQSNGQDVRPMNGVTATLIADVNFGEVSTTIQNGVLEVVSDIASNKGDVDGVVYGITVRSTKTDALLDAFAAPGPLNLKEGSPVPFTIQYEVPAVLSEAGTAYLTAYTSRGVPLATELLGPVSEEASVNDCAVTKGVLTCVSKENGTQGTVIRKGSPYGNVVFEKETAVLPNTPLKTTLDTLTADLPSDTYFIYNKLENTKGDVTGLALTEVTRPGDEPRLMSVMTETTEERGTKVVTSVIYVAGEARNTGSGTTTIVVDPASCGYPSTVAYVGKVEMVSFETTCDEGEVVVSLVQGGIIIDTVVNQFSYTPKPVSEEENETLPQGEGEAEPSVFDILTTILLAILTAGLLYVLVLYALKLKNAKRILLLFIALGFGFLSIGSDVEAATFAIGGTVRYETCVTGSWPNCAEPSTAIGYRTSGTVTVPDSVAPGQTYQITVSHSLTSTTNTLCDGSPCSSLQIRTYGYSNLPSPTAGFGAACIGTAVGVTYYNTLPSGCFQSQGNLGLSILSLSPGSGSGTFSRVAPSSGSSDMIGFIQKAEGNSVTSCTVNCLTYPYTYNSISIPISAPAPGCWRMTRQRTVSAASCTSPSRFDSPVVGSCTLGAITYRCEDDQPLLDIEFQYTCQSCSTPPPPINGDPGPANGVPVSSPPTSGLCSSGTPTAVSGSGPWTWTCLGSNGGSNAAGSAPVAPTPVNGVPGPANGVPVSSPPTSGLCSSGTPTAVSGSGPWTWTCLGSNGGSSAGGSAPVAVTPVNGVPGPANGVPVSSAPTSGLCSSGTPTAVSGSGPWTWTCLGSNGGSNAGCSAPVAPVPVNGVPGPANGVPVSSAPTSGLCSSGTPTAVSGSGPWTWTCLGSNGGSNAGCSAPVLPPPGAPVVTVTAQSTNGGTSNTSVSAFAGEYDGAYGGVVTNVSWTATNGATSCTVYRNGSARGTYPYPGVTQYNLPAGDALASDTQYRVDCTNGSVGPGNTVTFTLPPMQTNPGHFCSTDGTSVETYWTMPGGYNDTYVRLSDSVTGVVTYINDGTGNSYTFAPIVPSRSYTWWAHTRLPNGNFSTAVTETFSCVAGALPQCSDGSDNDGDGLIDASDPGCGGGPGDTDETDIPPIAQCSDGSDNDGDGLTDSNDPGCHSDGNAGNPGSYVSTDTDETNGPPPPVPQCSDGSDNDGDSLIDASDPGCGGGPGDTDEWNPPPSVNCPADPDRNGCNLPLGNGGQTAGSCAFGYGGSCSFTCNGSTGVWQQNSNSCAVPQITQFEICDQGTNNNCTNSMTIPGGTQATIRWSSNGDSCSPIGFSGTSPSGSSDITATALPGGYNDYTLICELGGTPTPLRTVRLYTAAVAPDVTASQALVNVGTTVRISWNTHNIATGGEGVCQITGGGLTNSTLTNGTGDAETGYVDVIIRGRTTFRVTCGTLSDTVSVETIAQTTES
jgi:hypothetical protein